MIKNGNFEYLTEIAALIGEDQGKLDTEMIGLFKKEKEKNQARL